MQLPRPVQSLLGGDVTFRHAAWLCVLSAAVLSVLGLYIIDIGASPRIAGVETLVAAMTGEEAVRLPGARRLDNRERGLADGVPVDPGVGPHGRRVDTQPARHHLHDQPVEADIADHEVRPAPDHQNRFAAPVGVPDQLDQVGGIGRGLESRRRPTDPERREVTEQHRHGGNITGTARCRPLWRRPGRPRRAKPGSNSR